MRESEVCVLCGNEPATTGEHVPPKAIFLSNPTQYLVVPACAGCNHSTALDDDYFRQVLSATSWTPEALDLWRTKVAAKFEDFPATRAGLRDALGDMSFELPGIGRAPVRVLLAKADRINRVVHKMVRGLYWFHCGELLPSITPIRVRMPNLIELSAFMNDDEAIAALNGTELGIYRDPEVMRTFFYQGAISPDNSVWYFFFYRQNALVAFTGDLPSDGATI